MGKSCGKIQIKETLFPDTNVILRYLLKDNIEQYNKISSIFSLIKIGEIKAVITSEIILETYYVLTKVYNVPFNEALEKLRELLFYNGIVGNDRKLLIEAINYALKSKGVGLLDWILCLKSKKFNGKILTFDEKLQKNCEKL